MTSNAYEHRHHLLWPSRPHGAISFSRLIALRVVKRTGLEHRDRCQVPIRIDGGRSLQLMEVGA